MPEQILDMVPAPQSREVEARDFLPLLTVQQAVDRKRDINKFIEGVMREGEDFGAIPGGGAKKVLMKSGAEKLCSIFGLTPRYVPEVITEDWTGQDHSGEPLFYYRYTCQLWRGEKLMGEQVGSCNSWEAKYRYRWVSEQVALAHPTMSLDQMAKRGGRQFEPKFAIDKAETTGKYGKPAEYWQQFQDAIENGTASKAERTMGGGKKFSGYEIDVTQYRIPNPDIADTVNTIQKMAQKRALVAAVLVVTNCSDAFTQDLEEEAGADKPEPRPSVSEPDIPQELAPYFANISGKGVAGDMLSFIREQFIEADRGEGEALYNEICKPMRDTYPGGKGAPFGEFRKLALMLWDALLDLRKSKVQEGSMDQTNEELLPF